MAAWKNLLRMELAAVLILAVCMQSMMAEDDEEESGHDEQEQAKSYGGMTGQILVGIEDFFQLFLPLILSGFMTFMAVMFIIQWHALPVIPAMIHWKVTPSKFWRQIGLNTLVFQIYYAPQFSFLKGKNFVSSVGFIFFDTVIVYYTVNKLIKPAVHNKSYLQKTDYEHELKADNWYMDVTRQFRRSVLCFFAQGGLVMYYVFELNSDKDTHIEKNVSVLEWIVALIVIEIAGDDEMGVSFNSKYWDSLNKALPTARQHWHFVLWCIPMPVSLEFFMRRMMDMVVNGVFRTMILGTAPIMLAVEGHMDFIKDVTALFFIMKLDDMAEPTMLTNVSAENVDEMHKRLALVASGSPLMNFGPLAGWMQQVNGPKRYSDVFVEDLRAYTKQHYGEGDDEEPQNNYTVMPSNP